MFAVNDQQQGPAALGTIVDFIARGQLADDTLLWWPGQAEWVGADEHGGVADLLARHKAAIGIAPPAAPAPQPEPAPQPQPEPVPQPAPVAQPEPTPAPQTAAYEAPQAPHPTQSWQPDPTAQPEPMFGSRPEAAAPGASPAAAEVPQAATYEPQTTAPSSFEAPQAQPQPEPVADAPIFSAPQSTAAAGYEPVQPAPAPAAGGLIDGPPPWSAEPQAAESVAEESVVEESFVEAEIVDDAPGGGHAMFGTSSVADAAVAQPSPAQPQPTSFTAPAPAAEQAQPAEYAASFATPEPAPVPAAAPEPVPQPAPSSAFADDDQTDVTFASLSASSRAIEDERQSVERRHAAFVDALTDAVSRDGVHLLERTRDGDSNTLRFEEAQNGARVSVDIANLTTSAAEAKAGGQVARVRFGYGEQIAQQVEQLGAPGSDSPRGEIQVDDDPTSGLRTAHCDLLLSVDRYLGEYAGQLKADVTAVVASLRKAVQR